MVPSANCSSAPLGWQILRGNLWYVIHDDRTFLTPSLLYSCTLYRCDVIWDPVAMDQMLHKPWDGGALQGSLRNSKCISILHVYSCHHESLAKCSHPATNWQLVSSRRMCCVGGLSVDLYCWHVGRLAVAVATRTLSGSRACCWAHVWFPSLPLRHFIHVPSIAALWW